MRIFTFALFVALSLLGGCASTTVETRGTALKEPLCRADQPAVSLRVYWLPQWRADQKEVPLREAAALRGIHEFLDRTSCLAVLGVHRLTPEQALPSDDELLRRASSAQPPAERILFVVVRELGPRLVIGIPTLIEGGTEVLVDVRVLNARSSESLASTQTLWKNGGKFVIKGVQSLDHDMAAALRANLLRHPAVE